VAGGVYKHARNFEARNTIREMAMADMRRMRTGFVGSILWSTIRDHGTP
jgi:predicted RNA-binding protein with PUA-like domain